MIFEYERFGYVSEASVSGDRLVNLALRIGCSCVTAACGRTGVCPSLCLALAADCLLFTHRNELWFSRISRRSGALSHIIAGRITCPTNWNGFHHDRVYACIMMQIIYIMMHAHDNYNTGQFIEAG